MENTNYEAMETENVELVEVENDEVNYDEPVEENGIGIVPVVVGVGLGLTAITVAVKKVGPKIKTGCENLIVNTAEKIKAKRALKAAEENVEVIEENDVDVIDEETEE